MHDQSTSIADAAPRDEHIAGCRRMLMALSEKGMELVGALDSSGDPNETALAFCRLSRAIRLNIMLDMRLEAIARDGFAALAEAEPQDVADAPDPAERPERDRRDRERLDRESPDAALRYLKRPMTEVVAAICKAYRLSPEATAQAQAPFAALVANEDGPDDPTLTGSAAFQAASRAGSPRSWLEPAFRARALGP